MSKTVYPDHVQTAIDKALKGEAQQRGRSVLETIDEFKRANPGVLERVTAEMEAEGAFDDLPPLPIARGRIVEPHYRSELEASPLAGRLRSRVRPHGPRLRRNRQGLQEPRRVTSTIPHRNRTRGGR